MPDQITAATLHRANDIRVGERGIWDPPCGQVQVQVVATGLCGSDLHYYTDGRNGDFAAIGPLILGHEASGIVTAVGSDVDVDVTVGQRVAIEPGINCRTCAFCLDGRYNLCREMSFCSSAARHPYVHGTLQSRINHPAHVLHPLPDNCTFELGALAEPLSVLIHASRRCQLTAGQSVIVFGVGTIGLLACALAKHLGASRVVAVDLIQARLDFAKENGFADDIFHLPTPPASPSVQPQPDPCFSIPSSSATPPPPPPHPHDFAEEQVAYAKLHAAAALSYFSALDGFDVVFECTGSETAIQMSICTAVTGGKVMLIGMGTPIAYLPLSTATLREVDIHGSFRYCNTFPEALKLLAGDTMHMAKKLVTHRYKLEDTKEAFELLKKGQDATGGLVLKVMVGSGVAC